MLANIYEILGTNIDEIYMETRQSGKGIKLHKEHLTGLFDNYKTRKQIHGSANMDITLTCRLILPTSINVISELFILNVGQVHF